MSTQDMDRFYASDDAPRPRWGFAARADESAPAFEADEADGFDDAHEVREVVDGLNWLGVAVTAATTLVIGIAIGVWVGLVLRPSHKPTAEPVAAVARRAVAPAPLLAAELPSAAATPPTTTPGPAAPALHAAMARLEPAPPETAAQQPLDTSTGEKHHHSARKAEPAVAPSPRQVAAARPVATTAQPEPEHFSPIDALLAATHEAPH
jgi:hypothetical protein